MLKSILYILLVLLFYSCASSVRFSSERKVNLQTKSRKAFANVKKDTLATPNISRDSVFSYADPSSEKVLYSETGIASYYADAFHGKRTASGEIYDMYELTAAHPTLPLGTIARITNLKNEYLKHLEQDIK